MKAFTIVLAGALASTAALAQTTTTSPTTSTSPMPSTSTLTPRPAAPVVTTPGATLTPTPGTNASTGTATGAGVIDRNAGTAAAAGNRNQAVATTAANAPQPARGANSFSMGEARRRIAAKGYATVADLKKDANGVWRGSATKDGGQVGVWLDYKGNVGQQ